MIDEKVLIEARKIISGFLRNRRLEMGITQEELAEMTGMGIATIRRFEGGKFWLNLKHYLTLCHYLQCYPFLVEKDSDHELAVEMRKMMTKARKIGDDPSPN